MVSRPRRPAQRIAAVVCLLLAAAGGRAADNGPSLERFIDGGDAPRWRTGGELGVTARRYTAGAEAAAADSGGTAVDARLEVKRRDGAHRQRLRLYGQAVDGDLGRSLVSVEELWAQYAADWGRFRVGADVVNWSALEGLNPADKVNARVLDRGNPLADDRKRGEPMLHVSVPFERSRLELMLMPYFNEPVLPAREGRVNPLPAVVPTDEFLVLGDDGRLTDNRFFWQGAVRYSATVGAGDWSVHALHHVDRAQPELVVDRRRGEPRLLLRPVTQVGATLQQVLDDWIVKGELVYRDFREPAADLEAVTGLRDRDHGLAAVGVEYGWLNGRVESTVVGELYSAFGVDDAVRRSLQVLQRDLLLGYRLSLNDPQATRAEISVIQDLEDSSQRLWQVSAQRRVLTHWQVAVTGQLVEGPAAGEVDGLVVPRDSDFIQLTLTRHF